MFRNSGFRNRKAASGNPENKETVLDGLRNLFAIFAKPEYQAEALREERKEELTPAEVYREFYHVAEDGDTAEHSLMNRKIFDLEYAIELVVGQKNPEDCRMACQH